jgi:hypothetical protein
LSIKNNTTAYELLCNIEIGIREFLISLIKGNGVQLWTADFLGEKHKLNVTEIGKRIYEATVKNEEIQIEEKYLYKANKIAQQASILNTKLFHPFYYLDWSDLQSLMNRPANEKLILTKIDKEAKNTLVSSLNKLNLIRNDVAHCRPITSRDLTFVQASYQLATAIVPDFEHHLNIKSEEESISLIAMKIEEDIIKILGVKYLDQEAINIANGNVRYGIDSFWINAILPHLIESLIKHQLLLKHYSNYVEKIGGILEIGKFKKNNRTFYLTLTKELREQQV